MVGMNVNVELKAGVGPVFNTPIRSMADVDTLDTFDPTKVDYIGKTIRLLTSGMLDVPLIGFCWRTIYDCVLPYRRGTNKEL